MSDPNNQYPAFDQSPYGQASYGQAPQGAYGQAQPGYGQAPQVAYGQAYMLNPALEKIRSNASNVRLFSFLSFVLGGIFLSGGMWFWANSMMSEAQSLGAPLDITTDLASARNTAKICSIIHIVLIVAVVAFYAIAIISVIAAGGSRY
ncbi:hypothetical protein O3684_09850 [Pauljensenia sp. 20925_1_27]|jgi:hypothetical protein